MNCAMCDHPIVTEVCGLVLESVDGLERGFCHGDDHDCHGQYNQAGLFGYPLTGAEGEDGTVSKRMSGEVPAMPPSEFQERMEERVVALQAKFPGTRIVLGQSAPTQSESQ